MDNIDYLSVNYPDIALSVKAHYPDFGKGLKEFPELSTLFISEMCKDEIWDPYNMLDK